MANRGRPIPFDMKLAIKEKRATETVRKVASELRVSKTTVQKYAGKFGTK